MSRKNVHFVLFLALLVFCGSTTACLKSPLTEKSPLTVFGTLENNDSEVVEAHIVLSRGKHSVELTVPVSHNEFQATIQAPVGQWELTVLLLDSKGIVRFQSKPQQTQIIFDEPTIIELVLLPAASVVTVKIDLDNYIWKHQALRARIHFNDVIFEVVREDSTEPLEKVIEVLPGSYEFTIELYTESFRVGDRLGPGMWEILHVQENEDLVITWSPHTQGLDISGKVEIPLPAPTDLLLAPSEDEVVLTWSEVTHWELLGYFVLAQTSPLDRFELLNSIPVEENTFIHVLDLETLPAEITYVVAAVSKSGLVGYYSLPKVWKP